MLLYKLNKLSTNIFLISLGVLLGHIVGNWNFCNILKTKLFKFLVIFPFIFISIIFWNFYFRFLNLFLLIFFNIVLFFLTINGLFIDYKFCFLIIIIFLIIFIILIIATTLFFQFWVWFWYSTRNIKSRISDNLFWYNILFCS